MPAAFEVAPAVNVIPLSVAGSLLIVQPRLVPDDVRSVALPKVEERNVSLFALKEPVDQPVKVPV